MEKERSRNRGISTEKFKNFKGIYIERTKEYFLCDFYEIQVRGKAAFYRVAIDQPGKGKVEVELEEQYDRSWKYKKIQERLPEELEKLLSYHIVNSCLEG